MITNYPQKEDASLFNIKFDNSGSSLFGIFDGHGGSLISKFSAQNFPYIFHKCLKKYNNTFVETALIETFLKLDEMLTKDLVNKFLREVEKTINESENKINYNFSFDFTNRGSKRTTYDSIKAAFASDSSLISESSFSYSNISINPNKDDDSLFKYEHESKNNSVIAEIVNVEDKTTSCTSNQIINPITDSVYVQSLLKSKNEKRFSLMLKKNELVAKNMGTTANIIYINKKNIYVANAGDSYSVMFKNKQAIKLNVEHKISIKNEEERILKAGCKIINGRLDGKLNLTRAIGI